MGRVYGVADPLLTPSEQLLIGAADISVTAGTPADLFTWSSIAAPSQGNYYVMIWASITLVLGATAPTAITFSYRLGSGSNVQNFGVNAVLLTNSANLLIPALFVGSYSGSVWYPTGSAVTVSVAVTAQNITVKYGGSAAILALLRGND
jgi:hypothetical protein